MSRILLVALLVSLAGCGPSTEAAVCNANNCTGCCTPTGACLDGTTRASCGGGGRVCATCKDTDYCVGGACSSEPACRYVNADCTSDGQCCTGLVCVASKCIAGTSCKNPGAECTTSSDCCSSACSNGTCLDVSNCNPQGSPCSPCCNPGLTCRNGSCEIQPSTCANLNDPCGVNMQCCGTGTCTGGYCR